MNRKLNITEAERKKIKQLYNLAEKRDYVFDFVLSENNKYLIIMDELFIAGGNGKSVGSIWENTYVFTEILKESVSNNVITESVDEFINNVEWKKEQISEWIKEKENVISEGFKDFAKKIFQKGILPFLRWVRRALYTGVGMVVDVVMSIITVKSNIIVWFIVVLLDIYEIVTGDYDPKDPMRAQMPYFLLASDLLGCVATSAVAVLSRKSAQKIATQGIHKGAPMLVKAFEGLAKKIPSLQSKLKGVAQLLSTKMGPKAGGVISKMMSGIDTVLGGFQKMLTQMLKPKGKAFTGAVQSGVTTLGVAKGLEKAVPALDKSGKVGQAITGAEKGLAQAFGKTNAPLTQDTRNVIDYYASL